MSTARLQAAAVTLKSGRVLVVGGGSTTSVGSALNTGEVYDPALDAWASPAAMTARRGSFPTATLLPSGQVLVAGGEDATGTELDTADLYDPATNTFILSDARVARTDARAARRTARVGGRARRPRGPARRR